MSQRLTPSGDCQCHTLRRGAVLIAALVCLVVVMALVSSMLLAALTWQRQLHIERDLRQCELLLEAGMDRAADRLASETSYRGETWNLPDSAIIGKGEGRVTIEVFDDLQPGTKQVTVVAEYPLGGEQSIRRTGIAVFPTNKPTIEESFP